MLTTLLAAVACAALAGSPRILAEPGEERIVDVVFSNLSVRFHPDQGCDPGTDDDCSVGRFVDRTLAFLAEDELVAPGHSWQRAECSPREVDDAYIDWAQPSQFSPRLAARLDELCGQHVWECSLAWGFNWGSPDDSGEIWWHREVRFLLADQPGHPLVRDSFHFHYTP